MKERKINQSHKHKEECTSSYSHGGVKLCTINITRKKFRPYKFIVIFMNNILS